MQKKSLNILKGAIKAVEIYIYKKYQPLKYDFSEANKKVSKGIKNLCSIL